MRNGLILATVILLLSVPSAFGQTASDIEMKYGKPTKVYSVSERIWMTPEYTADGQVCRIRLYPKRISADASYLSKERPFEEFMVAVDQLVPLNKRGAKKEPFGGWATGGRAQWAIFKYEKVMIMYSASFEVDPDSRVKPFVFSEEVLREYSAPERKLESMVKPEDDFLFYRKFNVEIVTITWDDRKCAGN
jgi:hypothetical protein